MHEIRAVTLSGYMDVARRVGIDGFLMLRRAGISPSSLHDPEERLPASAVVDLIDRSARTSGYSSFGLLLAQNRSFASAGPVSLLLERVPTVKDMVETSIAYRRHFNDVASLDLEVTDETAIIKTDILSGFSNVPMVDLAVGVAYRIICGASHQHWRPSAVHLVRKPPRDLAPWRRYFPVPVQFNSSFNGFECSSAALRIQLPLADERMEENARRLLQLITFVDQDVAFSDQTRRALKLLLPEGRSSIGQTAMQLAVSTRALQRSLREEGHTFTTLLNEVRRELAEYYLCCSSQAVTTIALQLGYSSLGTFSRWFVGEFGDAPRAWRSQRSAHPLPLSR